MSWWQEDMDAGYALIPEGKYIVTLDNVTCDETKTPNSISLHWKIIKGDQEGRLLFQNFNISEKSAKWLSWQLGTIGVWQAAKEVKEEAGLTRAIFAACENLMNKIKVEMEVEHNFYEKTGKTYANSKINDVLSLAEKEESAPKIDDDEEMPF